jgi:hypothetical protein
MSSISRAFGNETTRGKRSGWRPAGMVVLLSIALAVIPSCKEPTTPVANIGSVLVYNYCGATVDAYLDGVLRATIETDDYDTIVEIPPGSHTVRAYLEGTQDLVAEGTYEVEAAVQYTLYVYGIATISVTNQFGEILKIYMDDTYVGDIGNDITQTIYGVPFGTRAMVAKKRSDDTEAATASIDVITIADYPWIIPPLN